MFSGETTSAAARITCATSGLPPTSCKTLGRFDFSRVPFPAAMMAIAKSCDGMESMVQGQKLAERWTSKGATGILLERQFPGSRSRTSMPTFNFHPVSDHDVVQHRQQLLRGFHKSACCTSAAFLSCLCHGNAGCNVHTCELSCDPRWKRVGLPPELSGIL